MRRLTSAFERLAQTSMSSQLHLVDGRRRELMYVSLRSLYQCSPDEQLRSVSSSDDDDDGEDSVQGENVYNDHIAYDETSNDCNTQLTIMASCSKDMVPNDEINHLQAFYADLERTTEHDHTHRRSVAVDLSAISYGPNDPLSVAEFYSDLEHFTEDAKPRVVVDYSAMDYGGRFVM